MVTNYVIERTWKAAKPGIPPCQGYYLYTVWADDYKWLDKLTQAEYNAWKLETIKEDWKQ